MRMSFSSHRSVLCILLFITTIVIVVGHISTLHKITISILDTGIDYNNQQLVQLARKDIMGNIVGKDFTGSKSGILDDNGHGTHISGILKQYSYDSVDIIIGKVLDQSGCGSIESLIDGIKWSTDKHASIILVSSGSPFYRSDLKKAIDRAWEKGALIVAAAGNNGIEQVVYPAGNLYVLGVSSYDIVNSSRNCSYSLSLFSNFGRSVSITEPGNKVMSTMPSYPVYMNRFGVKKYSDVISGTSQAAAYVAAYIANFWTKDIHKKNKDILPIITSRLTNISNGMWNNEYGYGIACHSGTETQPGKYTKNGGIYAQITSSSGNPCSSAEILIDGQYYKTDKDGFCRIENLLPGIYNYTISSGDSFLKKETIQIKGGCDVFLPIVQN